MITHFPNSFQPRKKFCKTKVAFPFPPPLYFLNQDIHALLRPAQNGAAFKAESPYGGLCVDYCWEIIQHRSSAFTQKSFVIPVAPYFG